MSNVGSGTANTVFMATSSGPTLSTATYPPTATGTGTILRADGTNWSATTSTYPNTNAVSTLLYASSANVMSALTTANNGTLVTSNSGVPSILAGPGTTGNMFQSNAAAAPSFSTATYPSTATGTGTLLRADGTNWVATTSTYPNTNAVSTLLYASSANVMSALATANGGVLATNASGVPSIDTTNFAVLSTGLQLKGNNANTAPPAGFIGEQIRSAVALDSVTITTTATAQNITSINLTAGIWDITGILQYANKTLFVTANCSIGTTSATLGTAADNNLQSFAGASTVGYTTISVPAWRLLTTGGSTTVYLVAYAVFTGSQPTVGGRISATRVG